MWLMMSWGVGAHHPSGSLPAAEHVRLFQQHRLLVETLVDHGLGLAASQTPLERAEECRRTVRSLGQALQRAAAEQDLGRCRQLTDLLGSMVTEGLASNLREAARWIPPESPEARRLQDIRDRSRAELVSLRQQLSQQELEGELPGPLHNAIEQLLQAEQQLRLVGESTASQR
jgi:hypothetical protein